MWTGVVRAEEATPGALLFGVFCSLCSFLNALSVWILLGFVATAFTVFLSIKAWYINVASHTQHLAVHFPQTTTLGTFPRQVPHSSGTFCEVRRRTNRTETEMSRTSIYVPNTVVTTYAHFRLGLFVSSSEAWSKQHSLQNRGLTEGGPLLQISK